MNGQVVGLEFSSKPFFQSQLLDNEIAWGGEPAQLFDNRIARGEEP